MANGLHCNVCDIDFVNYFVARYHRDALRHWECEWCRDLFDNEHAAEDHMNNGNHRSNKYRFECKIGFADAPTYKQQMESSIEPPADVLPRSPPCVACPFCKITFVTYVHLVEHISDGGCRNLPKVNRDTTFNTPQQQNISVIQERSANKPRQPNTSTLQAPDRESLLSSKTPEWQDKPLEYTVTPRTWNGSAFECYLCNGKFNTLGGLIQHLESPRHKSSLYYCPHATCNKQFTSLATLFNHLESETCDYVRFEQVQRGVGSVLPGKKITTFR